jgi:hypothetical protein
MALKMLIRFSCFSKIRTVLMHCVSYPELQRHGILNVVGWGILLPIGIMFARYLRQFESADPAWFYLHAFCQTVGYALGVAGWATGLKLGSYSKGVVYSQHRSIGIAIFVFGTLQVILTLYKCILFVFLNARLWVGDPGDPSLVVFSC